MGQFFPLLYLLESKGRIDTKTGRLAKIVDGANLEERGPASFIVAQRLKKQCVAALRKDAGESLRRDGGLNPRATVAAFVGCRRPTCGPFNDSPEVGTAQGVGGLKFCGGKSHIVQFNASGF